jgi:hypothetical protein
MAELLSSVHEILSQMCPDGCLLSTAILLFVHAA